MIKHLNTALFIILIILLACKKNTPALDTTVQPETDALGSTWSDTTGIFMHTIQYDSSRTYSDQFKYLGSNQDPVFGRTDASIFTNFGITDNVSNLSFGDDAVLDSCQLILAFTQSFVGDSTTALTYSVHQLSQALTADTRYFMHSNVSTAVTSVPYNSNPIAGGKARVSLTDGFYTIKLSVNQAFAQGIFYNPQYLINNTIFQGLYKGFYVTTRNTNNVSPSSPGAIMKIDLDNPVSGIYMYYHNGPVSAGKASKKYRFSFAGDYAIRFNKVEYNYSTTGAHFLLSEQLSGDSAKGSEDVFLKGLGGTKAVVRFPSLTNYASTSHVAISRAEVIFKVDQSFVSAPGTYDPGPQLSLVAMDSLSREAFVVDQFNSDDLVHYGGAYDADNKQYVFNIARHVQDIMDGKRKNYGFYLVVANPDKSEVARRDSRAERVVLGGSKNALYSPKFHLTYVKFPYDK